MANVTPSQVADALDVAESSLSLIERLADLFAGDNVRRAARLRNKAIQLLDNAAGVKSKRRADRMRARARGMLAEAESLDPSPSPQTAPR